MLIHKPLIIIILTILAIPLMAQQKDGFDPDFRLSQSTLVSSGKDLPFWMVSNQNGIFTLHNPSYMLFQAGLSRTCGMERDILKNWSYTCGANMVYSLAGTSNFHPNPAHLRLAFGSVATVYL